MKFVSCNKEVFLREFRQNFVREVKGRYTSDETETNLSPNTGNLRNTGNFISDGRHFLAKLNQHGECDKTHSNALVLSLLRIIIKLGYSASPCYESMSHNSYFWTYCMITPFVATTSHQILAPLLSLCPTKHLKPRIQATRYPSQPQNKRPAQKLCQYAIFPSDLKLVIFQELLN